MHCGVWPVLSILEFNMYALQEEQLRACSSAPTKPWLASMPGELGSYPTTSRPGLRNMLISRLAPIRNASCHPTCLSSTAKNFKHNKQHHSFPKSAVATLSQNASARLRNTRSNCRPHPEEPRSRPLSAIYWRLLQWNKAKPTLKTFAKNSDRKKWHQGRLFPMPNTMGRR